MNFDQVQWHKCLSHDDLQQGFVSSSAGTQVAELYTRARDLNFFMKNLGRKEIKHFTLMILGFLCITLCILMNLRLSLTGSGCPQTNTVQLTFLTNNFLLSVYTSFEEPTAGKRANKLKHFCCKLYARET